MSEYEGGLVGNQKAGECAKQRGSDVYRRAPSPQGLGDEFQVYLNDEFVYGQQHNSRWMVEDEASAFLKLNESQGWKMVTSE